MEDGDNQYFGGGSGKKFKRGKNKSKVENAPTNTVVISFTILIFFFWKYISFFFGQLEEIYKLFLLTKAFHLHYSV